MNTEKLNRWLTLGANFGVVLGLIILIVEVRQNAALTRLSQETARASMLAQAELSLATPAASDAWMKSIHAPENLTDGELRMAETQLVAVMQQWDTLFSMEQEGLVDRARVKRHIQNTAPFYFGSRFAKRWWEREEIGWSGTSMFEVADPIIAAVDPDFLVKTYAFIRAPFDAALSQEADSEASPAAVVENAATPIEDEAQQFMAAYANDLRTGDRQAVAARYHPSGAILIFNGAVDHRAYSGIEERYLTTWAPPQSFQWSDLTYTNISTDVVLVVGQFTWGTASGAADYSYTGVLRREGDALRIILENETQITPNEGDTE